MNLDLHPLSEHQPSKSEEFITKLLGKYETVPITSIDID